MFQIRTNLIVRLIRLAGDLKDLERPVLDQSGQRSGGKAVRRRCAMRHHEDAQVGGGLEHLGERRLGHLPEVQPGELQCSKGG